MTTRDDFADTLARATLRRILAHYRVTGELGNANARANHELVECDSEWPRLTDADTDAVELALDALTAD